MHIFIDESGPFSIPAGKPKPAISCIGALSLPSAMVVDVYHDFAALTAGWPNERGEIKGRLLNETDIAAALQFFADKSAIFNCVAIDLGLHTDREALAHHEQQAGALVAGLTDRHKATMIDDVKRAQAELRRLKVPDYFHMVARTTLIDDVMRLVPLYKCQRDGADLGDFDWTFDAKDKNVSRMERLWDLLFMGFLESRSLREPMVELIGGDWAAFNARYSIELPNPPAHLVKHTEADPDQPYRACNIKAVMANRRLGDSAKDVGLQMIDVATSAARRGMRGTLRQEGWEGLSRLMIRPMGGGEVLKMIRIGGDRNWTPAPPYMRMLRFVRGNCLPLLID